MKNKNHKIWQYIAMALLVFVLVIFWNIRKRKSGEKEFGQRSSEIFGEIPREDNVNHSTREAYRHEKKKYHFTAEPLPRDPDESSPIIYPSFNNPAFQMGGGVGGRFTIKNRNGELIWRGNEENWVFSISISPNEELIAVGAGDGNGYIINSNGEKIIDLPQFPPGRNMLGMGNWVWISNDQLLGKSGIQKYDENGKLVTCCGGDNVSESRFFIYDLKTRKMEEMLLPEIFLGKVIMIRKVLKSGEFQLVHEGDEPHWFRIKEN